MPLEFPYAAETLPAEHRHQECDQCQRRAKPRQACEKLATEPEHRGSVNASRARPWPVITLGIY